MIDLLVSHTVHATRLDSFRRSRKEEEEEEVDEEKSLFFGHETPITPKQNNYNEIIDQAQSPRL